MYPFRIYFCDQTIAKQQGRLMYLQWDATYAINPFHLGLN